MRSLRCGRDRRGPRHGPRRPHRSPQSRRRRRLRRQLLPEGRAGAGRDGAREGGGSPGAAGHRQQQLDPAPADGRQASRPAGGLRRPHRLPAGAVLQARHRRHPRGTGPRDGGDLAARGRRGSGLRPGRHGPRQTEAPGPGLLRRSLRSRGGGRCPGADDGVERVPQPRLAAHPGGSRGAEAAGLPQPLRPAGDGRARLRLRQRRPSAVPGPGRTRRTRGDRVQPGRLAPVG